MAVCFNRRFTPAYAEVARWPGLDTVVLTKNRVGLADDPRLVVFDDFVHVVDTLRFLVAPEPDDVQVVARAGADGTLARVAITLRQGGRLGVGVMDRDSGQTIEILDAMAPGRARQVTDLVDVVDRVGGVAEHRQPDNWASVAQQRRVHRPWSPGCSPPCGPARCSTVAMPWPRTCCATRSCPRWSTSSPESRTM